MTQAILITAYKKVGQLNDLIDYFPETVNIYIHIDKKNKDIYSKVASRKDVFRVSEYPINWAGFNHLRAILFLSEKALKNKNNQYFHLISGEDYPCPRDFCDFQNRVDYRKNYISFFSLPDKRWAGDGGLYRVNKYHLNDVLDAKKSEDQQVMRNFLSVQVYDGLFPRTDFRKEFKMDLFGGSTWWSLGREALDYVSKFTKRNPEFYDRFQYTFCSEEIYFQTVLLNSRFSSCLTNDNLRHIDWTPRNHGGVPCYLDERDFENMINGTKIFARKLTQETVDKYKKFLRCK